MIRSRNPLAHDEQPPGITRLLGLLTIAIVTLNVCGCDRGTKRDRGPAIKINDPFVALVDRAQADSGIVERAYFNREFREVFDASYSTGNTGAHLDPDGSVRLGDLIAFEHVSGDAIGIAIDMISGEGWHYEGIVNTDDLKDADSFNNHRVFVQPPLENPDDTNTKRSAIANVSEVLPLPKRIETPVYHIESGMQLNVGFGFGVGGSDSRFLSEFSNQPDSTFALRRGHPIRFTVSAETDHGIQTLFDETRSPRGLDNASNEWLDVSLDLSALAGQDVAFIFLAEDARPEPLEGPSLSGPVFASPTLINGAAESDRPNLILICLDTLRADRLGTYGYDKPTSPNLDAFAEDAYVFDKCYTPSSWTLPTHTSVMTGLHPSGHGTGIFGPWFIPEDVETLAEAVKDAGYLTSAITEGIAISGQLGFNRGFRSYNNGPPVVGLPHTVERTFFEAQSWLSSFGEAPFFLFVHTYEIHAPFTPPQPFYDAFDCGPLPPGPPKSGTPEFDAYIENLNNSYDGSIAYTDAVLGGFLNYLEESGLLQNTYVIIFSDHGERLGEHFDPKPGQEVFVGHGETLTEQVLHVPLILRFPGVSPNSGRIPRGVSLTDIFATSTSILGIQSDNAPLGFLQSIVALRRCFGACRLSESRHRCHTPAGPTGRT